MTTIEQEIAAQATPRTYAVLRDYEDCNASKAIMELESLARTLERERALLLAKVRAYLRAVDELNASFASDEAAGGYQAHDEKAAAIDSAESALRTVVNAMDAPKEQGHE